MHVKSDTRIDNRITDNIGNKITDNKDNVYKNHKNSDKKQKLLCDITGYFFDSAEKNNLDNEKVNKVIKDVQYIFKKDPKQKDIRCFICEND